MKRVAIFKNADGSLSIDDGIDSEGCFFLPSGAEDVVIVDMSIEEYDRHKRASVEFRISQETLGEHFFFQR